MTDTLTNLLTSKLAGTPLSDEQKEKVVETSLEMADALAGHNLKEALEAVDAERGKKKKVAKPEAEDEAPAAKGLNANLVKSLAKLGVQRVTTWAKADFISTPSLKFDYMTGGGFPREHMTIMRGPYHSGKTTYGIITAIHGGKRRLKTAFFDTERGVVPDWVQALGGDEEMIHFYQGLRGESILDAVRELVNARAYDMIIIDSIAKTRFKAQIDAGMDDNIFAVGARKWTQFSGNILEELRGSGTALVMTNHVKPKIGGYEGETTSPGGEDINKYDPHLIITTLRPVRAKRDTVGPMELRFHTEAKNRFAPARSTEVKMLPDGDGYFVDPLSELTGVGKDLMVFTREDGTMIEGSPTWFFEGEKLAQGEAKVQDILASDPGLTKRVRDAVYRAFKERKGNANGSKAG